MGLIDAGQAGSYKRTTGHVVCSYDPAALKTANNVALCRYGMEQEEQILLTATRSTAGELAVTTQPLTVLPPPAVPPPVGAYEPISPALRMGHVRTVEHDRGDCGDVQVHDVSGRARVRILARAALRHSGRRPCQCGTERCPV